MFLKFRKNKQANLHWELLEDNNDFLSRELCRLINNPKLY